MLLFFYVFDENVFFMLTIAKEASIKWNVNSPKKVSNVR